MATGNAGGNGGNGAPIDIDIPAYDRLAPELRRMIQNFALPISAAAVEAQANRYGSLEAFQQWNRPALQKFRDMMIRKIWGADHPMLGLPLREDWT